jgi:hypothetical protein
MGISLGVIGGVLTASVGLSLAFPKPMTAAPPASGH